MGEHCIAIIIKYISSVENQMRTLLSSSMSTQTWSKFKLPWLKSYNKVLRLEY